MQSSTFLIVALGYLVFGISTAVWISKKKKAGEKISLRAKIIIAVIFLSGPNILLTMIELSPAPETSVSEDRTYYVKAKSANVRECPSTSCKVIDSLSQNTPLTFPGDLFDKYPDWVEVTFPNGEKGYVSKTTLSENIVPESQHAPTDDSSSAGGITIGPWSNIQMTLGDSYELYFCEPPSAISGATCGALADTTTDPRGGTPPYSFIKKSGFLPPGVTLELNGTLRGSPTQVGTYNFRLCAKDLYGGEGCQNLAVLVKEASDIISNQPKDESIPPAQEESSISPWVRIDSVSCEIVGVSPMSIEDYPEYLYLIRASGEAAGNIDTVLSLHENPFGGGGQYPMLTGSWETIYWKSDPNASNELLRVSGNPATTAWSHSAGGGLDNQRTKRTSKSVEVSATLYGNKDKTIYLGSDKTTVVCSL